MNENLVDILIYLYENYMDSTLNTSTDQEEIHQELLKAGFHDLKIYRAFQWMDELALQQGIQGYQKQTNTSTRIYSDTEQQRLDMECRGLLLFLEQNNILDQASRELVIDRAIALDTLQIDVDELKWVVLLVLLNQPGRETAFAQIEDMVYNDTPVALH